MAQTATTGNLESAQKIILAVAKYTEEHNAPALNLIEQFPLPKGAKQVTVPKVGQMSMLDTGAVIRPGSIWPGALIMIGTRAEPS